MKQGIQTKVVQKMREYFQNCDFVNTNKSYLQATTKRVLHSSIHDYHKRFQIVFDEKKRLVSLQTQHRQDAENEIKTFSNFQVKATYLLSSLEQVSFQE
jgi:hypothetical protein